MHHDCFPDHPRMRYLYYASSVLLSAVLTCMFYAPLSLSADYSCDVIILTIFNHKMQEPVIIMFYLVLKYVE